MCLKFVVVFRCDVPQGEVKPSQSCYFFLLNAQNGQSQAAFNTAVEPSPVLRGHILISPPSLRHRASAALV